MRLNRSLLVSLSLISSIAAISGCSLLGSNRQTGISKPAGPQVRDVPFSAREVKDSRDVSLRKRVMVLPFIDVAGTRDSRSIVLARDAFIKQIKKTDDFVVVATSDFPKDVSSFLKSQQYDLEAMAKIASGMGVSAIIEGKVIEVRARRIGDEVGLVRKIKARMNAKIQLRMINTRNGSILLDEQREAEVEEGTTRVAERAISDRGLEDDPTLVEAVVNRAFAATVPRLMNAVEKLSWEGRVALVKGDRIFLNAGRLSGLQVGDILRISEEGEDVYDPESGSFIGRVPGRLKGTVEVISYFGKDGAIGLVHSGSGFRENDLVELY